MPGVQCSKREKRASSDQRNLLRCTHIFLVVARTGWTKESHSGFRGFRNCKSLRCTLYLSVFSSTTWTKESHNVSHLQYIGWEISFSTPYLGVLACTGWTKETHNVVFCLWNEFQNLLGTPCRPQSGNTGWTTESSNSGFFHLQNESDILFSPPCSSHVQGELRSFATHPEHRQLGHFLSLPSTCKNPTLCHSFRR